MRSLLLASLAGIGSLLACATAARADIILMRTNSPVATGDGFYAYTYNVRLTAGQLDPVSNGSPVQFGTIYDFGPLVTTAGVVNNPASPGSVFISKTGLLADSQNQFAFKFEGTGPAATDGSISVPVNDNPNLTNIRLTYVGSTGIDIAGTPTTLGAGAVTVTDSDADLGTFTVYSPIGTINPALTYDGQTFKGSNNTQQANEGSVSGPLVIADVAVPEPGSLALLGVGMLGALAAIRRKPLN